MLYQVSTKHKFVVGDTCNGSLSLVLNVSSNALWDSELTSPFMFLYNIDLCLLSFNRRTRSFFKTQWLKSQLQAYTKCSNFQSLVNTEIEKDRHTALSSPLPIFPEA